MKNRRISVEYARTNNLLDFESTQFRAGLSGDVEDDASLEKEYGKAWDEVKIEVTTTITQIAIPIIKEKMMIKKAGDERIKEMVRRRNEDG